MYDISVNVVAASILIMTFEKVKGSNRAKNDEVIGFVVFFHASDGMKGSVENRLQKGAAHRVIESLVNFRFRVTTEFGLSYECMSFRFF